MTSVRTFQMHPSESFPHLPGAPIVEAVIHWQARGTTVTDSTQLLSELQAQLPDYPHSRAQRELVVEAHLATDEASQLTRREGLIGYRFESADGKQIVQFQRDGIVFSRLAPYQDWIAFQSEALRLWRVYAELTAPVEIQRLGVRYINRIAVTGLDDLSSLLSVPPQASESLGLPLGHYLYRTVLEVPGHPYRINVIQTIQPTTSTQPGPSLILDTDVFTIQPVERNDALVLERLSEMRWLKNKVFFTLLTQAAIDRFKEPTE